MMLQENLSKATSCVARYLADGNHLAPFHNKILFLQLCSV